MNNFLVVLIFVFPAMAWMLFHKRNYTSSLWMQVRLISVVFVLLWLMGQISEKLQLAFPSDQESPLSIVVFGITSAILMVILMAPSLNTNGVNVNNTQRYYALLLLVAMAVFDGLLVVSLRHSSNSPRFDLALGYHFNQTKIATAEIWNNIQSYRKYLKFNKH